MKKKICVITGSRSDYGLLSGIMKKLHSDDDIELKIIAIAAHLSDTQGRTYKEIESDGYKIHKKIECLLSSDSSSSVTKSMGLALIGLADALVDIQPDLVLLLGDRFEIFCAATASLVSKVPICHIHGGEVTLGSIDDSFRHSISKMSSFHFCAAEEYRRRLIQMGESPSNVYTVGALGVENIYEKNLLSRIELEEKLNINFTSKILLVAIHPVMGNAKENESLILELLISLRKCVNTTLIFTAPNADENGYLMRKIILNFVRDNGNSYYFPSLGRELFLSLMSHVDGIIGNSSSAIIEAPSLLKGSINIGDRQTGRLLSQSIISCGPLNDEISKSIELLYTQEFQAKLKYVSNPYFKTDTSKRIFDVLKKIKLSDIAPKQFFNIE